MDWSNERYVRVYTRDTADWSCLSWQARALWVLIMRKLDRSGVLATAKGPRGVAALVVMPVEVVEPALAELLEDGCLTAHPLGYVAPNYLEAQECTASDAARQRESRARRGLTSGHTGSQDVTKRDTGSQNVTESHEGSHGVTGSHTGSHGVTPCLAVPSLTKPEGEAHSAPATRVKKPSKAERETVMPEGWAPSVASLAYAGTLGLDPHREAEKFKTWTGAKGARYANWDLAFRSHLNREADRPGRANAPAAKVAPPRRPAVFLGDDGLPL